MKKWISGIICCLLVAGCASSKIDQLSSDIYMVRVEDHSGIFASNSGTLRPTAIQEANDFAASEDKIAVPIAFNYHPVGILGDWAAVEYQFQVVAKSEPGSQETSEDLHAELVKLEHLREEGTITMV